VAAATARAHHRPLGQERYVTRTPDPGNAQPNDRRPDSTGWLTLRKAVIGALCVVILSGGVLVKEWMDSDRAGSTVGRAYTPPGPIQVAITPPANGSVHQCAVIRGTGAAPAGTSIWVSEHGQGSKGYYSLTRVTADPPDQWHVTLDLGTATNRYEIFVFVLGDEAARVLESIQTAQVPHSATSYSYLENLPVKPADSRTVTRDNATSCQ
jgi:hypothetical protein